ncbi:TIGR01244 family protein [Poseidonocella pacifica]|uniref:TIGR01244 family protein n=1 Tax=Poseidonocella pacifica TaxID=871651 RepID=A0A1I0X8Q0_9RHOB|nr:TIGR01244 family sulfur transferase [Poseidonocella pacifica]SFA97405.1 TIGR01244 family protein [Poseidonocella pacifica]
MDVRQITPRYSVTPQIAPEDIPQISAAGFTAIICNRPDVEIPADIQSDVIRLAAEDAGIAFHVLPLTHDSMTPERVEAQMTLIEEADGPVLAYCASGTRCTVIWALGQAGKLSADEILGTAFRAGYQLEALRPRLEG